jgi:hypothetical protein
MEFDNDSTAVKIQMQKQFCAVVVVVLIALLQFIHGFSNFLTNFTGLSKSILTIILLSFFLVFYFYHLIAASSFIYYCDADGKITLRFYQLNGFNTSKLSYEIPKNEFTGFKIEKKYRNIRENLILFRKYQGNIVNYPPISISALTKSERTKLLRSLALFGPQIGK